MLLEEIAAGERRDEVREDEEDAEHGETFFLCGTPPLAAAPCTRLPARMAARSRRGGVALVMNPFHYMPGFRVFLLKCGGFSRCAPRRTRVAAVCFVAAAFIDTSFLR